MSTRNKRRMEDYMSDVNADSEGIEPIFLSTNFRVSGFLNKLFNFKSCF